jgi:hypothetical protein
MNHLVPNLMAEPVVITGKTSFKMVERLGSSD